MNNNISRETAAYVEAGMSWNCPNCGRPNKSTARFCAGCGAPKPEVNMENTMHGGYGAYIAPETSYAVATKKQSSGTAKIIAGILAAILLLGAIGFGAWFFFLRDKVSDEQILANEGSEQVASENEAENTGSEADSNYNPNAADPSESVVVEEPDDSRFKVGSTYTVVEKEGVRVRRGPDTSFEQLSYDELTDYEKSQAQKAGKACIAKGGKVTCLEMSGDWMRIESGWVCTYYEGATLIE